ncbi:DoxX family protein [Brachybacterium saurashtrense]|uniref:DoxX family protein n=1 Tax=Brachybacterium saurashtrense TaxID=556288 RepID=A0A345YMX9_9MICO|nr:DoxX family protein [Brachybacterium saurashtrense]AXK45281.1 DoxX family protein [Brachybacterium saurashtrense]RRR21963.1 DoxX family protein [Brachybacterium saurashtrense]
MDLVLWILAFVLAAIFAATGLMKLLVARDQQIVRTPYVEDFPQGVIRGIGALELLGALGLILPGLLSVATILVPMAAAGLAITMVFAALVHQRRGDGTAAMVPSIVLAVLSVAVAWLRFGVYPL